MARVQVYGPQRVQQAGTTGARLVTADFDGSAIARGGMAIGRGLDQLGDALQQEQLRAAEQDATTRAKEADANLARGISATLNDPDTGYTVRRGKTAVDTRNDSIATLEKVAADVAANVPDGLARRLYDNAARQRLEVARTQIDRHYAVERETWQDDTSEARIKLAASDAGNAFDQPDVADEHIATAVSELHAMGTRKGWDETTLAQKTLSVVSGIRREIAGRLTDMNPELGAKYKAIHPDQFTSADADAVDDAVRVGRARILAEQRRVEAEQRQALREEAADLSENARDAIDAMERGNPMDATSISRMADRLDALGKGQLADNLRTTAAGQAIVAEGMKMSPAQLQQWINDSRTKTGDHATAEQGAQIKAAEDLLGKMKQGLATDPLSWAVRAGVARLDPIDPLKANTVDRRVRTAVAVANRYGTKPQFLTDEEQASLVASIGRASATQKGQIAGAIATNFGRYSRDVLGSISKDDPIFAHAAAMASMGGYHSLTARRIFAGQEAMKSKSVQMPADGKFDIAAMGQAMNFTPSTRGATVQSAKAIYAAIIAERGIHSDDVVENLWLQSLHMAAGASYSQAGRVGGYAQHKGVTIVLPTDVRPEEFDGLVGRIRDADLKAAPPRYGNGKTASAADIQRSYLFDAGNGRYFVAVDRLGTQFLQDGNGRHYILDLGGMTARLRGRK